jgi:hypothetical protein
MGHTSKEFFSGRNISNAVVEASPIISTISPHNPLPPKDRFRSRLSVEQSQNLILEIADKLGITPNDYKAWYKVSLAEVFRHEGRELLQKYNFSLNRAVGALFQDHSWNPNEFSPNNSLEGNISNLRAFLTSLGKSLGFVDNDFISWYKVSAEILKEHGAVSVLKKYKYRLPRILRAAFPEHSWNPQDFERYSEQWTDEKRRQVLETIGEKLGIKELSEWYKVPFQTLRRLGGDSLFRSSYSFSRYSLFSKLIPDHEWHPLLFKYRHLPPNRMTVEDVKSFLNHLERIFNIDQPEGWYSISKLDFAQLELFHLFRRQSDFVEFLQKAYPSIEWQPGRMAWSAFGWSHLKAVAEQLLGSKSFTAKQLKTAGNLSSWHQRTTLFYPNYKLAIEYQGPSSYVEQLVKEPKYLVKIQTEELSKFCANQGFSLISVPFWWNRDKNSLLAEILKARIDLFESNGVLEKFSASSLSKEGIPKKLDLSSGVKINLAYFKLWANDPRFQKYFN